MVKAKRVRKLMRADNLLKLASAAVRSADNGKSAFLPDRAQSGARGSSSGLDPIGVADITYVRLAAASSTWPWSWMRSRAKWSDGRSTIISRRGWRFVALAMAIAARDPPKGLIHHSDRGVQYACGAYAKRLADHGIEPSMSRHGDPYDNAKAESFMKTLKAEEANGQTYVDLADARSRIGAFIDTVYNADRLHSALGYASPIAFEETFRKSENYNRQRLTALSIT